MLNCNLYRLIYSLVTLIFLAKKPDSQLFLARSQAYLAEGKLRPARFDIDNAIELDKDALASRSAAVLYDISICDFNAAIKDMEGCEFSNNTCQELKSKINVSRESLEKLERTLDNKHFKTAADEASKLVNHSLGYCERAFDIWIDALIMDKQYKDALLILQKLMAFQQNSAKSEFLAAKIHLVLGNLKKAGSLLSSSANADQQFIPLRRKFVEMSRNIEEAENKFLLNKSIDTLESMLHEIQTTPDEFKDPRFPSLFSGFELPVSRVLCAKLVRIKRNDEAIKRCKIAQTLDSSPTENYWILIHEAHQNLNQHEEAIRVLREAHERFPLSNSVIEALNKAQKELKKSKRKDHYKILGVSPSASIEEIQRAYNRAARRNHPDKQENDEAKKRAEAEMQILNQSYAVLKDPKKRQQYDSGIDVDDPNEGASPFQSHGGSFHFSMNDFEHMFGGFGDRRGSRNRNGNRNRQSYHFYQHDDL